MKSPVEKTINRMQKGDREKRRAKVSEVLFWLFVSVFIASFYISSAERNSNSEYQSELIKNLPVLFLAAAAFFVPIMFSRTFEDLPITSLLRNLKSFGGVGIRFDRLPTSAIEQLERLEVAASRSIDPRKLLSEYVEQSAELAERIYKRAGVYLIAGVMISFSGLLIFYFRVTQIVGGGDVVSHVLDLLPGFGVLFFVEFVAIFFLRQHRAAMDDFRYYDGVRRHREEILVALHMFAEHSTIVSPDSVLKAIPLFSASHRLAKDETTELIEARKLSKDEIVIIENLIDAIAMVKAKK